MSVGVTSWIVRRAPGLALGLGALLVAGTAAASLEEAERALREGRYDDAVAAFEAESTRTPTPRLYKGWAEALRLTGRYEEALEVVEGFRAREPASGELETTRGRLLYGLGRVDEARAAFERAIQTRAHDRWSAELQLAVLIYEKGELEEALGRFDRFIDLYNQSSSLEVEELLAVGTACRYLGVTNHELYRDALKAYDEAQAKDPGAVEPAILAGELFLEKYNSPDAAESFENALAIDPNHPEALLGLARLKAFDGSPEALALTKKALDVNPSYVAARAFLAEQLLEVEDYEGARAEVEKALAVNPVSPEALPMLAATELLEGNEEAFEEVVRRALARNPRFASFFNELADVAVKNRLYHKAVTFSRRAVELDERSWWGYGLLGLNELRLGDIESGRKNLERSFAGDPFNVWIKNTLDLLDTYVDYETTTTERFEIFVEGDESALLTGYVERIADEAYERLAERYRFRPETPIRIEVYPSHGDFSVRTLGLPGLGALGVCFGPVIAVDSPSARPKGQFNFASTLWHELAHTVTLGVTDHRVPRWLSEGLSVLEERHARPGWGDDVSLPFLAAYKRGKLLPIGELNNGFMRPTYPQQVGISYYQASLVTELVERDFGFAAVRNMLDGYRRGLRTEEVFQTVLGLSLEEFDDSFEAYLKERFEKPAAALRLPPEGETPAPSSSAELLARAASDEDDFLAHLGAGRHLVSEGKLDEAEVHLERAKILFPDYGGEGSYYPLLARIHEERGAVERAVSELARYVDINENDYDAHVKLAGLYESLGRKEEAAGALERAVYIYPFELEPHRSLAKLYRGLGRLEDVVVERQALVALTTDRAQALYELALAHHEAGDAETAKRELLRALEIAPGFQEGLSLLLRLRSESDGGAP